MTSLFDVDQSATDDNQRTAAAKTASVREQFMQRVGSFLRLAEDPQDLDERLTLAREHLFEIAGDKETAIRVAREIRQEFGRPEPKLAAWKEQGDKATLDDRGWKACVYPVDEGEFAWYVAQTGDVPTITATGLTQDRQEAKIQAQKILHNHATRTAKGDNVEPKVSRVWAQQAVAQLLEETYNPSALYQTGFRDAVESKVKRVGFEEVDRYNSGYASGIELEMGAIQDEAEFEAGYRDATANKQAESSENDYLRGFYEGLDARIAVDRDGELGYDEQMAYCHGECDTRTVHAVDIVDDAGTSELRCKTCGHTR